MMKVSALFILSSFNYFKWKEINRQNKDAWILMGEKFNQDFLIQ